METRKVRKIGLSVSALVVGYMGLSYVYGPATDKTECDRVFLKKLIW